MTWDENDEHWFTELTMKDSTGEITNHEQEVLSLMRRLRPAMSAQERGKKMKVEIGAAWIARDEDGRVWQYDEKPRLGDFHWRMWDGADTLDVDWLPGVPWDESCREVTLYAEVKDES